MPLARAKDRLIYFAHIPKCAGTTVEHYLQRRFGQLALLDRKFGQLEQHQKWSNTSPQHMTEVVRKRLVPDGFCDFSFAIVRHPVDRLRSVFLFQKEIEAKVCEHMSFTSWLKHVEQLLQQDPWAYDNHIRPMIDFVPEQATVFQLENGLGAVIKWLDQISGETSEETMPFLNVLQARLKHLGRSQVDLAIDKQDYQLIQRLYAQDFDLFGYELI